MTRSRPTGHLVTAGLLALALVVVAALIVPWDVLGQGAPAVHPTPGADFTAAQVARDSAFHDALRPWTYTRLLVVLALILVLGLTPAGARLVRGSGRLLGGSWPAQVVAGTVALTAVTTLAGVPFEVPAERVLRRFGLSTQHWGGWAVDLVRGWVVSTAVTALLLLVLVALARRWPRRWWAGAAALAAVAVVLGSLLYPLVVEPLANSFTPLPAGSQRTALLDLARRDGLPVDQVLVADASKRTTGENAYVSGLGATRRIVVYDTLLTGATPREVELVVAHELGHVKTHDVRLGTGLGALAAAFGVVAAAALLRWRALLRRAGADGAGDPRVVALLLALVAVGSLLSAPASTLVSRRIEARADVHSLVLTRDPQGFAAMQRRLAVSNISDLHPGWWRTAFFETHPSSPWRVAMARAWAAQHGLPAPGPVSTP